MTTIPETSAPTGEARRRRMSPAQRRRQLIELGMQMSAEQPLEAITIDAVAERAGVSRALLFHYFDSKQDFHVALITEQSADLLARTAPRDDLDDPVQILTEAVSNYVDYVAANREGYLNLLRVAAAVEPELRKVVEDTRAQMAQRILHYAPALGLPVDPAVELAVAGWLIFVEELMIRWITEPTVDRDQLLGILVGSLPALAGVAAAAG